MADDLATKLSECTIELKGAEADEREKKSDSEKEAVEHRGRRKKDQEEEVVLEKGVKGRVKWYNVWNHYGFIGRDDDPNGDVFVHQSGISKSRTINPRFRTLVQAEEVVFDIVAGKGEMKKAVNVTGPDGAKVQGCYFFEQFMRSVVGVRDARRRSGYAARGDARPGYARRAGNPRRNLDADEKGKKRRSSDKANENAEDGKAQKGRGRRSSENAKDKKKSGRVFRNGGRQRRNVETSSESGKVEDSQVVSDGPENEQVEAKAHGDAPAKEGVTVQA